jgi:deazaflavin-dependent oxidoreductase (nitroreductase family)
MTTPLRHVDASREPSAFARFYAALAATRVARVVSRWVSWKLDPILLRATGGRVATTLVFPTAVLETVGAKSGARRRNAVIYFHDGERVTIVASNAGSPRHPSWYHNLARTPTSSSAASRCVRRSCATRPSAHGSGCSPIASFPRSRAIGAMPRRWTHDSDRAAACDRCPVMKTLEASLARRL